MDPITYAMEQSVQAALDSDGVDDDAVIEAMARAICRRNWPSASDRDVDEMWDGWEGDARAALAAYHAHQISF